MDKDGNITVPNGSNFSSPNISSTDVNPVEPAPQSQQAITSSDISAMANTDAGDVAAAAAALPENDARGVISSGAIVSQPATAQPTHSHAAFTSRRFNATSPSSATSSANIPDFFAQATAAQESVSLYGDGTDKPRGGNIRIKILVGLVGAIILVVVAGLAINGGTKIAERNEVKSAWNKFTNQLLSGEAKEEVARVDDSSSFVSKYLSDIYGAKSSADSNEKFNELVKRIDEVIEQNSSANIVQGDELADIKDQLSLMRNIAEVGAAPSAEKIAVCYAVSGEELCNVQIDEHYNHEYDDHNDIIQAITSLQLKQVSYEKVLANLYVQHKCVSSNGTVKKKCTSAVNSSYIIPSFAEEYATAKSAADRSVQVRVKGFLSDIKQINSEINK